MPVRKRALIIGLMGPAIQAAGLLWQAAHFLAYHLDDSFTVRHMLFEPGLLMVLVGFLVSVLCIPLAIDVATAEPRELEIPTFGVDEGALQGGLRLPGADGATTLDH